VRYRVADLPITVTLDDTQAMIPTMTLSSAASVTVGARVSASGNAIGQTGDWFGELENISTANEADTTAGASAQNPLRITIDQQRP